MTPRTADRLFRAVMVLAIAAFVVVVAVTGCHAPRAGYGVPRHLTAVGR